MIEDKNFEEWANQNAFIISKPILRDMVSRTEYRVGVKIGMVETRNRYLPMLNKALEALEKLDKHLCERVIDPLGS